MQNLIEREQNVSMRSEKKLLRTLFVENCSRDVELISAELRCNGFELATTRQVETAAAMREALSTETWDVILCDHSLPRFDSLEALQLANKLSPEIPFIIVSGTIDEKRAAQAMRSGAADYLSKDNLVRLTPIIERELRQTRLRSEHRKAEEAIKRRQTETIRNQETLLRLAAKSQPDFQTALRDILESDAKNLELDRVSFWSLRPDRKTIVCEALYLNGTGQWERGLELHEEQCPLYFKTLETNPLIAARNAQTDPRTSGFLNDYYQPLGIVSSLDVPVWLDGRLAGVVCHESKQERDWCELDQKFAVSIGQLVATALGEEKRRNAETALQHSQFEYESLVNSIEGIVWEADARTFRFSFVSHEAERLLGYPLQRWLNESHFWLDRIHPDDRERALTLCREAIADRKDHSLEIRMIAADGRIVWLRNLVKVFSEDGKPKKLRGIAIEITQLKQAESALRASEFQLRSIVETTPECVKMVDQDGALLQMNQAGLEMIEADDFASVKGRSVYGIIAPEHRDAFKQLNEKVCQGERATLQFEIIGLRGSRRWMETIAVPIRKPDGALCQLGITRDITARRESEQRKKVFASLMQKLNLATTPKAAARIIFDAADKLFGWDACGFDLYSPESQKLNPILHLDTLNGLRSEIPAPYKQYPPNALKLSVLKEGGKLILRDQLDDQAESLMVFGNPRRSASLIFVPVRNGDHVMGILSIQSYTKNAFCAEDVEILQSLADHCGGALERIAAQEAQETLMDELTAQHKRLDELLASVPGVVWEMWITPNGQEINFTNQYIETLLGYSVSELVDTPNFWISIIHPEDRERAIKNGGEVFARGGQGTEKLRWIAKDGRVVWIESQFKTVFDEHGKPIGLRGVSVDISERLELEMQFRQAQKMESVGQLAGGIAHDFNNILTVIQGHSSLLKGADGLPELLRESAEQISLASDRAANLTRQLLTFSRRQVTQPRPLDLNEVIGNFSKMLRRVVGEDIALRVNYAPTLPIVFADSGMMEQLIMNLAVNSRDAMPKGGELTIETSTCLIDYASTLQNPEAVLGDAICLSVSDTGCGISQENLARIFEPFFTTKGVGQGTGLGLATVYGIVKQHSGWIKVQSEVGKGTTFQIFFPASKQHKAPMQFEIHEEASIRGGDETILVVEDELSVRILVRQLLKNLGYKVLEAESGVAALKLFKQNKEEIHLLLTDMVMPDGITGRELAEIVQFERPEIKVIYTSGYNAEIVGKDFVLNDGLNFLQKPYAPSKLAKAIRDCLGTQLAA